MFQFKLSNLRTSFFKRKLRNNFLFQPNPYDKILFILIKNFSKKINFLTSLDFDKIYVVN